MASDALVYSVLLASIGVGFMFFLLGWLRWWIGAIAFVVSLFFLAQAMADGATASSFRMMGWVAGAAVIITAGALALAAGVWFDRWLCRRWGVLPAGPAQDISLRAPLHPRVLDAIPAFVAALLCGSIAGYVLVIAFLMTEKLPGKPFSSGLDFFQFLPGVLLGAVFYGALENALTSAFLFFGAFFALRRIRALNLPWFAFAGAVAGIVMAVPFLQNSFSPFAVVYVFAACIGGFAGYFELRRRVARYPAPASGSPAEAVSVQALRRTLGPPIAAVDRFGAATVGAPRHVRSIVTLSWALAGAVTVFALATRSSVLAGLYPAEEVAWPATVAAVIAALLLFALASAIVARLGEDAGRRLALASVALAAASLVLLPRWLYAD